MLFFSSVLQHFPIAGVVDLISAVRRSAHEALLISVWNVIP
jgi:hypothetical protein